MHIIACSYEHIWPFADHIHTVRFLPWASLIKAPIGSWKSFLFFDWLIFGLYKRSTRPMVSRHAKQWQIQVLFSHAGSQRLIIRELKSTKAGNDSVTSKLFRVQQSREDIARSFIDHCDQHVICLDVRITDILLPHVLEEIPALGQKEIDAMILDLLPSREVTLSSCILMQESDNVFEMTPAMRITVFKQLFDLLDMDHVRDHLAELRKTTQLRRQVLQEDMTVQQQFSRLYNQLRTGAGQIKQLIIPSLQNDISLWLDQPFLVDLVQLEANELHMEWSILQGYAPSTTKDLIESTDSLLQAQLFRQGESQQLVARQEELNKTLLTQAKEAEQTAQRLVQIGDQLGQLDTAQLTALQKALQEVDNQLEQLWKQLPSEQAAMYGLEFTSITQAQQLMQQQIQEAKQLQQDLAVHSDQEALLVQQRVQIDGQISDVEQQIVRLQTDQSHAQAFRCELIKDDCPYVAVIRKTTTSTLEEQVSYFTQQLTTYREVTLPDLLTRISNQEQKKQAIQERITQKKAMFTALWWKEMEGLFQRSDELLRQRREHADALRALQARLDQSAALLDEQQRLRQREEQLHFDRERVEKELVQLTTQMYTYNKEEMSQLVQQLKQLLQLLQRFEQLTTQLASLVDQFIERQQQIRLLQDKEAVLKDLLHIFQKELLLVVLQDFLPVLEEVINSYLQQVVNFSLRFELPKTVQEQMELLIWIEDENGKRAVKSLSGGQKAVLRLCRILAVSTLFKQEYLLLDETINSLDVDAIGRVAELLDSFVKQREVTFYLVTHAPQIQDMSFWRRIIEITPTKLTFAW
jgi:DNA repair exonuclease SbcCD ATPase subunit